MSGGTPLGQDRRRRLCIDDEWEVVKEALADAELEKKDKMKAVERGRKRLKSSKQKRSKLLKLLASGELNCERLRIFAHARILELERELKAARLESRAATARRDQRYKDQMSFEYQYYDAEDLCDNAGIQQLDAAEVAEARRNYWRFEHRLEESQKQLFA